MSKGKKFNAAELHFSKEKLRYEKKIKELYKALEEEKKYSYGLSNMLEKIKEENEQLYKMSGLEKEDVLRKIESQERLTKVLDLSYVFGNSIYK